MPSSATPGLVLTSSHYADILTGGGGNDTLVAGQGPDRLTGGAGADTFAFKALPWNGGEITDFTVGVDRLDISGLYLGGYAGADPVADGYVRFESNGAGGTKVMLDVDGPAQAHPWAFLIATLDGVSPAGLTAAILTAPAATDPSVGLVLTASHYADVLTGGAGPDTLVAGQGPDLLTGGPGADTFRYTAMPWNGGEIADFHPGVDRLDISALYARGYAGGDPVGDGYVRFESDGAGGTKVMLDVDGPAGPNPFSKLVTILDGVSPGALTSAQVFGSPTAPSPAPTPSPSPALPPGLTIQSTGDAQALVGGAGADTLVAGQSHDTLTGLGGPDHFVFGRLPWSAGHVTDFTPGSDVLDLRPLFQGLSYSGSDPVADHWLEFRGDGAGGVQVYVDSDGPSGHEWPTLITTLDHVTPAQLAASDWLV